MAHIVIEGMDGVGKTTTCRLLSERLGYKFIEKNLRFLFDENDEFDNYFKIRDKVMLIPIDYLLRGFMGLEIFIFTRCLRMKILLPIDISFLTMLGADRTIIPRFTICL